MSLTRQLRRSSLTLLFVVAPHGGQATARRNAWAGMSGAEPYADEARRTPGVPAQREPAAARPERTRS